MANEKKEKETVTGLDTATNRNDAEYDLLSSLFEAADYKNNEIHETEIKRGGKVLFTIRLHPLSDSEARVARKNSTTYAPHPNGAKYGRIEKDFNNSEFGSWLIYLSTVEEDQRGIWGRPEIMQRFGLQRPMESIDVLLTMGEKRKLVDLVSEISGINDEEDDEAMDEETFQ